MTEFNNICRRPHLPREPKLRSLLKALDVELPPAKERKAKADANASADESEGLNEEEASESEEATDDEEVAGNAVPRYWFLSYTGPL